MKNLIMKEMKKINNNYLNKDNFIKNSNIIFVFLIDFLLNK